MATTTIATEPLTRILTSIQIPITVEAAEQPAITPTVYQPVMQEAASYPAVIAVMGTATAITAMDVK